MEYLVFLMVLLVGLSSVAGLIAYVKKGTARESEDKTKSFLLIKEYIDLVSTKGDLCDKFEKREELQGRMRDHLNQIKIKQEQKKQQGVIVRLEDYRKR